MTDNHNPFVLPGFGQSGEFAGNPVMASMEMMRQAWQSLAGQGGFGTQSMAATMSAEDLERRIADLRAVENWLRMNLTVLSNTIQGLEVQRATISTLKNFVASASGTAAAAGQDLSAFEALLGIRPASRTGGAAGAAGTAKAGGAAAAPGPQQADPPAAEAAGEPEPPLAAVFDSDKAVAATQAWWGLLQKQFDSLAAATSATMQGAAASDADATARPQAAAASSRKRASGAGKPAKAPRAATPAAAGAAKPPRAARPAAKSAGRTGGAKTSGR